MTYFHRFLYGTELGCTQKVYSQDSEEAAQHKEWELL